MTPTARTRCPQCGANLMTLGGQRLCLDCAYREETPAPAPEAAEVRPPAPPDGPGRYVPPVFRTDEPPQPSPTLPAGTPDALWLAPRRNRGGVTTPLGFQAGHPCPRVCGGTLSEEDGTLLCSACDFRYPEGGSRPPTFPDSESPPALPEPPDYTGPAPAPETTESSPSNLVEELRREVQRLREENLLLARMVTDFLHGLPKALVETDPVAEVAPPASEDPPIEPAAAEETPARVESVAQPEPDVPRETGGNPWWRRNR